MNNIEIPTKQGHPLALTIFESSTKTSQVALIISATGVKQTFYKYFAHYLSENGITAITFDYAGIGLSKRKTLRNVDATAFSWGANDLDAVMLYVKQHYSGKKITLIGHSIGGQLIGLSKSSTKADKIILVASQSGYWKFWKGLNKYKMWANWYLLFPAFTALFGYLPSSKISSMEDLPKGVARQWRKWCIHKNYLFDDTTIKETYYDKITCSIKSYSIEDDAYAPEEAVNWLALQYKRASVQRVHIVLQKVGVDKIGHFGFFKKTSQSSLWQMLLNDIQHGFSI